MLRLGLGNAVLYDSPSPVLFLMHNFLPFFVVIKGGWVRQHRAEEAPIVSKVIHVSVLSSCHRHKDCHRKAPVHILSRLPPLESTLLQCFPHPATKHLTSKMTPLIVLYLTYRFLYQTSYTDF